jgi:ABC-type transport system involved in multi-copper enzyme maturation permease subunit
MTTLGPPETALNARPPTAWRIAFWACVAAWLASIAVIALSVIFAVGFGVIGLFGGTLGGFFAFWLGVSNYAALFLAPLIALLMLYAIRPFIKQFAAPADPMARSLAALIGIAIGVALVVATTHAMHTGETLKTLSKRPLHNYCEPLMRR